MENKIRILSRLGLDVLHEDLQLRRFSYEKGETIYNQDSKTKKFFILEKGLVQLHTAADSNKDSVIGLALPGNYFGEIELITNSTSLGTAKVLIACEGFYLSAVDFNTAYKTINFCQIINAQLARNILLQQTFYAYFLNKGMETRLSIVISILYYAISQNDGCLEISQEELAQIAGLSRPPVNKILRKWEDEKIIDLGYNRIKVLAIEKFNEDFYVKNFLIKVLNLSA